MIKGFIEVHNSRDNNNAVLVNTRHITEVRGNTIYMNDALPTATDYDYIRAVLFSAICNSMPDKAWKSKLHDTGDMFEGMFIVGIETPDGQATYHYDIEPYWDMFKVRELEKAPKWDGHTPTDAINRIASLSADVAEVVRCKNCRFNVMNMEKDGYDTTDYSGEDIVCSYFLTDGLEPTDFCSFGELAKECPNGGAKMDGE